MMRASKYFAFALKDLKRGMIKTKDDMVEYWVYRQRESNLENMYGKKILLEGEENVYLHAIILCAKDHIQYQNEEKRVIEGVKFDNFKTKDLDNYLSKTKRTGQRT